MSNKRAGTPLLFFLVRLAWLYMNGEHPKALIDHMNRITSDNRYCNLREVTQSQNLLNSKIRTNNRSGIKGVSWNKQDNNWIASLTLKGVRYYMGAFKDINDAKLAVMKKREELHGEFANHG